MPPLGGCRAAGGHRAVQHRTAQRVPCSYKGNGTAVHAALLCKLGLPWCMSSAIASLASQAPASYMVTSPLRTGHTSAEALCPQHRPSCLAPPPSPLPALRGESATDSFLLLTRMAPAVPVQTRTRTGLRRRRSGSRRSKTPTRCSATRTRGRGGWSSTSVADGHGVAVYGIEARGGGVHSYSDSIGGVAGRGNRRAAKGSRPQDTHLPRCFYSQYMVLTCTVRTRSTTMLPGTTTTATRSCAAASGTRRAAAAAGTTAAAAAASPPRTRSSSSSSAAAATRDTGMGPRCVRLSLLRFTLVHVVIHVAGAGKLVGPRGWRVSFSDMLQLSRITYVVLTGRAVPYRASTACTRRCSPSWPSRSGRRGSGGTRVGTAHWAARRTPYAPGRCRTHMPSASIAGATCCTCMRG